jgi:hypothetical protein
VARSAVACCSAPQVILLLPLLCRSCRRSCSAGGPALQEVLLSRRSCSAGGPALQEVLLCRRCSCLLPPPRRPLSAGGAGSATSGPGPQRLAGPRVTSGRGKARRRASQGSEESEASQSVRRPRTLAQRRRDALRRVVAARLAGLSVGLCRSPKEGACVPRSAKAREATASSSKGPWKRVRRADGRQGPGCAAHGRCGLSWQCRREVSREK